MSSNKDATRRSFYAFDETCPVMDEIFDKMLNSIEEGQKEIKDRITYPFREALTNAYTELIKAEKKIESLEEITDQQERRIEELKDEIEQLRGELAEATAVPQESGN